MVQRPILNPATAAEDLWPEVSFRALEPKIRRFGYVPNAHRLLPGDVILVSGNGLVPNLIRVVQASGGFHPDHARWTHAALYIGSDRVVEATPLGGVRVGQLAGMTFGRQVLVRRRTVDPRLTIEHRYEIAIEALAGLRRGYSLTAVPHLIWEALMHRLCKPDQRPNVSSVVICSSLVRNAYTTAITTDLLPRVIGVAWPADLSQTAELADVTIGWVKVIA